MLSNFLSDMRPYTIAVEYDGKKWMFRQFHLKGIVRVRHDLTNNKLYIRKASIDTWCKSNYANRNVMYDELEALSADVVKTRIELGNTKLVTCIVVSALR